MKNLNSTENEQPEKDETVSPNRNDSLNLLPSGTNNQNNLCLTRKKLIESYLGIVQINEDCPGQSDGKPENKAESDKSVN